MNDHLKQRADCQATPVSLAGVGEFRLIERLTRNLNTEGERVVVGIGDDAAVLQPAGANLVVTCDSQVDGVHFRADLFAPEEVGQRAAAVNLSDVAAMGGLARWAVISLLLPEETSADWLSGVYRGLTAALGGYGCAVVGGNVSRTQGPLTIDITLIGEVERERALLRSGARVGDLVCVTGELGEAAAGLQLALNPDMGRELPLECTDGLLARYRTPTPRLEVGRLLRENPAVTSCIDLSDGLVGDAGHIAEASGVRIQIDVESLPLSESLRSAARQFDLDPRDWALSGGDDFELLFTAPQSAFPALQSKVTAETSVAVTAVGRVSAGEASVHCTDRGRTYTGFEGGFDHFRKKGSYK